MLFQRWHVRNKLRGVKVYSLVGPSGSGKSYRAGYVMEKYSVDILVDDGLIIRNQKILCGKTAKNAKNILDAVSTAIFIDEMHRREAQQQLTDESFKRILLIGTSDKMIRKICHALLLPLPHKRIAIEEITTEEERQLAIKQRESRQSHIVPAPVMEVQQMFPSILAKSLNVIIRRSIGFFKRDQLIKKSIVRPAYSDQGDIRISRKGLTNIVEHCIKEHISKLELERITIHEGEEDISINIYVALNREVSDPPSYLPDLQKHIIQSIQDFSGIIIGKLNIIIDNIQ